MAVANKVKPTNGTNKRINWGLEPNKWKLEKAISDWIRKKGDRLDSNGEVIDNMNTFCNVVGISKFTLQKYVHKDPNKRRKIGNSVGNPPLLPKQDQRFLSEIIVRKDRANNGIGIEDVIDRIQELNPSLTSKQAANHFHRTLKRKNNDLLKKNLIFTSYYYTTKCYHSYTAVSMAFICE